MQYCLTGDGDWWLPISRSSFTHLSFNLVWQNIYAQKAARPPHTVSSERELKRLIYFKGKDISESYKWAFSRKELEPKLYPSSYELVKVTTSAPWSIRQDPSDRLSCQYTRSDLSHTGIRISFFFFHLGLFRTGLSREHDGVKSSHSCIQMWQGNLFCRCQP